MEELEETSNEFSLSPERLFYKIGEVGKILGVEAHVIRYWERLFPEIRPSRSKSGQRVYTKKEIDLLSYIKRLQFDEGYTIQGVKKKLQDRKLSKQEVFKKNTELVRYIKTRLLEILNSIKT
ncbi:MAG: MerR family transcriptional regulator [Thermodesulfovibrionales bacterium]|nr:MerR family transcriptional regulator [Thermodesulfovibrionales bacterium]